MCSGSIPLLVYLVLLCARVARLSSIFKEIYPFLQFFIGSVGLADCERCGFGIAVLVAS